MKFLTNILIVSDDKGIISNPTGRETFYGSSSGLLNNLLFTTDTFQTYVTTNSSLLKNETIWYNGDSFPFLLNNINYNAALSITNSSFLISCYTNSSATIFSYNNQTKRPIYLTNNGYLMLNKENGFGDFVLNDSSSINGHVLYTYNNYVYWKTVGPTVSVTAEGYSQISGLSNVRSFSATFSFNSNSINSLRYSVSYGWPATSSIGGGTFGATSSSSNGVNFIDIYHNLNNQYPVISFWGLTKSYYMLIDSNLFNSGIGPSFSVLTTSDRIRLSFIGSFSSALQVNIMG